jgi:hypothetical protein
MPDIAAIFFWILLGYSEKMRSLNGITRSRNYRTPDIDIFKLQRASFTTSAKVKKLDHGEFFSGR